MHNIDKYYINLIRLMIFDMLYLVDFVVSTVHLVIIWVYWNIFFF